MLHKAVVAACDAMDGLADGVISTYEKCVGRFDPNSLRCPNGADTGSSCLSDAQIVAVQTLHRPFEFGFPVANGVTAYPGWNYGGEDQPGGIVQRVTRSQPAQFPLPASEIQTHFGYGSGFIRYFIARDPTFNPLHFSPANFVERTREISSLIDSTDPDLSAFAARGGKLIVKENASDYAQSVLAGIDYYRSVVATLGQARVDQFIRLYVTPGVNHAGDGVTSSGAAVPAKVDLLGALDSWVDTGEAPDTLVQVSQEPNAPFAVLSSRPMCRYPLYPRYDGHGDPKQASSFICSPQ
jgi:feruloyl esterase